MANEATFYLRIPKDLAGLKVTDPRTGKEIDLPYAAFLVQYQVPRMPNTTAEQNAALVGCMKLLGAAEGDEYELHAAEGKALQTSLPQLGDKVEPGVGLPFYLSTQPFYTAILSMPTTKPDGWTGKTVAERDAEKTEPEEAPQENAA